LKTFKKYIKRILRSIKIYGDNKLFRDSRLLEIKNSNVFFGYYDKNPFSEDETKLLALTTPEQIKPLVKDINGSIGYFDMINGQEFIKVSDTNCINWQQGCRLMWHPIIKNQILFNTTNKNSYVTRIIDINTSTKICDLPIPTYDIDSQGKYIATLNFSRLHDHRPGYGYINFKDTNKNLECPDDDGVWLYDIKSNKKEMILSYPELKNVGYDEEMDQSFHYINHLLFSPNGENIFFYHVWENANNRYHQPVIMNIGSKKVKYLTKSRKVTHETWIDDDNIMLYSNENGTWCYNIYNIEDLTYKPYALELNLLDGHPTMISNETLITDTYPDKFGYTNLYKVEENNKIILGKFYLPAHFFGEIRVDLHPRVSKSEKYIICDIYNDNNRAMILIENN